MIKLVFAFVLTLSFSNPFQISSETSLQGAWKSGESILLFSGKYYSIAAFRGSDFLYTQGGSWISDNNSIVFSVEYDTGDSLAVGSYQKKSLKIQGEELQLNDVEFSRIDNGTPGDLAGTWLFNTRVTDGKRGTPRSADDPRKTMKILSGTRFQWIAFNVQTGQFFGTGGGTYTTVNGKYTEHIDFFSRDSSRVGASLEFDYKKEGDDWHHQGLNSRGEPLYEIWTIRK